jgi:hypothetical protein
VIEITTIIEGEGVAALPDLIETRFPRGVRRRFETMQVFLLEHLPGWVGCAAVTSIICAILDPNHCRVYILVGGGWFPFPAPTSVRRYRHQAHVFKPIQEICAARGWLIGEITIMT